MSMRTDRPTTLVVLTILILVLGGCASGAASSSGSEEAGAAVTAPTASAPDEPGDQAPATDEHNDETADDHASDVFAFGEPADPAVADRTVQVRGTDQMTFEPATVEVRADETITFEVTNVGQIPHDFTLGDEQAQQEHAREMEEMDDAEMAHMDPNTVTIPPGATESVTWRFHDAGEVLYGCHQPGHYDAGMVGSVDVTP